MSSRYHNDATHVANKKALYGELDVFGTCWHYLVNLKITKAPRPSLLPNKEVIDVQDEHRVLCER